MVGDGCENELACRDDGEDKVVNINKEKNYKAPRMIVDHNQPYIGIAHIVCMYITGKVICKCMVEQNIMTVYQIGNCLTTVIAEVLHVPRITINLL